MSDGSTFAQVSTVTPLITRKRFAELVGLPVGVVNAQCDRGFYPVHKVGKYSLINLALLNKQLLEREFSM